MKKKFAFTGKAISCIAAFALVATMCPATALADDTTTTDETQQTETTDVDETAATSRISEDITLETETQEEEPATTETKAAPAVTESVDVLRAQVTLEREAATLITQNGLTYIVNSDENTVSLVGWSGTAPTGTLEIPSTIYNGADQYIVSTLENVRGGVHR